MKKHFLRLALFAVILMVFLVRPVFAWMPDSSFWCRIDPQKIPEGTVYIDLLLPVSQADEGYTAYHQGNGEKYQIAQDSQIVRYEEDGFVSYTFHIVDACSEIRPYYTYDFSVDRQTYEQHPELLADFESNCFLFRDGESRQYTLSVFWNSAQETQLDEIASIMEFDLSLDKAAVYTQYVTQYREELAESPYNFDYLCEKYKWIKFAYLDEWGNILAVSNAVNVDTIFLSPQLNLRLSGMTLTSDPTTGPPTYLLSFFFWGVLAVAVVTVVALLGYACYRHMKSKKEKTDGQ